MPVLLRVSILGALLVASEGRAAPGMLGKGTICGKRRQRRERRLHR